MGVVGFLCLGSGIIALTLPETINQILPDSMEKANNLRKKSVNKSSSSRSAKAQESNQQEVLRDKLFSEDWVDAGNGIIVNFNEGKSTDSIL